MYGSQEKILGQKVNVKFFTVGPYVPLALVRQTILKKRVLAKHIFLKYQQNFVFMALFGHNINPLDH